MRAPGEGPGSGGVNVEPDARGAMGEGLNRLRRKGRSVGGDIRAGAAASMGGAAGGLGASQNGFTTAMKTATIIITKGISLMIRQKRSLLGRSPRAKRLRAIEYQP